MINKKILKNQSFKSASKRFNKVSTNFKPFWQKHQLKAVAILAIIFGFLTVATQFTKAQPEETVSETSVREVETLTIGESQLNQNITATVKNLNSITLVAQSAGPVSYIGAREGAYVGQGGLLVSQNSSYSGGNINAVGKDVARKNLQLSDLTLKNTVEVVSKNRELADKNRDNTEELRKISEEAIGQTESLITTTNQVIEKLEADIAASTDAATTQALRQQLVSYQGSLNQTESGLRAIRYQVDKDNPPEGLANASKDLVYKSTELQLQSAAIGRDIAALNYKSAEIAESLTRVVAPFGGTVEKVFVEVGQYVTPGTPIAKISGTPKLCLVANVSGSLASQIDLEQSLTFKVGDQSYTQPINHVTTTPVSGNLFEVLTTLPEWFSSVIYENQSVEISLPLINSTQAETQFIPVDAVFVTNTSRFVYVLEDGIVVKRIVDTGDLVGSAIEVKSGLTTGDQLILDRSVNENELVEKK